MLDTLLDSLVTTSSGWLQILTLPPAKNDWYSWPEDRDKLIALDIVTTNFYFSPHLFNKQSAEKPNVLPTRTLCVDLDNADVTDLRLNPTWLVETSPGRHQGYWVLKETLPLEEFELLSKQLSYTIVNADHSGWSLGHKFRVPGGRNFKYDTFPEVKLIVALSSERIFEVEEIRAWVGDTDVTPSTNDSDDGWINNPPTESSVGPRELMEKYRQTLGPKVMMYFNQRQADRSEALWALMLSLFRAGATRDEVFWIAKHSENNKFADHRYAGDRDLAKDVDRAQRALSHGQSDLKELVKYGEQTSGSPNTRKRLIATIVMQDLIKKGEFVTTDDGKYWFLHANAGRPVQINKRSDQLDALLDTFYNLNALDGYTPYVVQHMINYVVSKGRNATHGVLSKVIKDGLLLHSGKSVVYHITKDKIERGPDGSHGVLFPWRPPIESPILIDEPLVDDWASWLFEGWFDNLVDLTPVQATNLIRIWFLFLFFRDEAVSRPILSLLGTQGSGKSTLFRLMYVLLYGRNKSLNAISTPDDYTFLVSSDPMVVFDNVDTWASWLPDQLALSAAASDVTRRKLYTDNDTVTLKRQAIVGLTAHDPRFGRGDVVDRMIILNFTRRDVGTVLCTVCRLASNDHRNADHTFSSFTPEGLLIERVEQNRSRLWGSIVADLQKVLATPYPPLSQVPEFRISDFARLGTRIAQALGLYGEFVEIIQTLRKAQVAFSLSEDQVLVNVIQTWHAKRNGSTPDFVSAGYLYEMFSMIDKSFDQTFKSASVFARRLQNAETNLKALFDLQFTYDHLRGIRMWKIDPLGAPHGVTQQAVIDEHRDQSL